jgi:hypothetical protein
MAAVTKGTAYVYGISGTVTGITVQSYTVTRSFELDDKVQDETGKTVTHRLDGRTNELSLEGVLTSAATFVLSIGDKIIFAGNEVAFTGCITRIEDRGQNKGFTLISLSATEYEAITY